ncbi:MAG: hypothetical protein ABIH34_08200 [Nanoarchaeota archaeon]
MSHELEKRVNEWRNAPFDERIGRVQFITDHDEALYEENVNKMAFDQQRNVFRILLSLPGAAWAGLIWGAEHILPEEWLGSYGYDRIVSQKASTLKGVLTELYDKKIPHLMHLNAAEVYALRVARKRRIEDGIIDGIFYPGLILSRSCERVIGQLLEEKLDSNPNAFLLEDEVNIAGQSYSFRELEGDDPLLPVYREWLRDQDSVSNDQILLAHGIDLIASGNYFSRDDSHFTGKVKLGENAEKVFEYCRKNGLSLPYSLVNQGSKREIIECGMKGNGSPEDFIGDREEEKAFGKERVINLQHATAEQIKRGIARLLSYLPHEEALDYAQSVPVRGLGQ